MALWKPHDPPSKKQENTVEGADTEGPVVLSEEGKRKAWRLLALLEALRARRPDDPISLDEIDQLGCVAEGDHDLHIACAALRNGCALEHLVGIFT